MGSSGPATPWIQGELAQGTEPPSLFDCGAVWIQSGGRVGSLANGSNRAWKKRR